MDSVKLNITDEYQNLPYEEVKKIYLDNSNKDAVLCLNLKGELNIGTIIRTASTFGMGKIFLVGKRSYDKRTTVGTHNYIPIEKINATKGDHNEKLDTGKILEILKELSNIYEIVFIEHGGFKSQELKKIYQT